MLEGKKVSDKDIKKEERRLKREAREERRYGNHVIYEMVQYDLNVKSLYDKYKSYSKSMQFSVVMALVFMGLGALQLCGFIIELLNDPNATISAPWGIAVDMLLALYWMLDVRITESRRDLTQHQIFYLVSDEAKEKWYDAHFGKTKEGNGK